ncbi:MAG: PP2C family protein-serine/threonine phosphatase [Acidobacteriota bacterium]
MTESSIDDLIRLPEAVAIEAYLDANNRSSLHQLTTVGSVLAVISIIVGLSESRYRSVTIWLTLLALAGALFLLRGSRFYERNVRHLLMALQIALLAAVVLTVPDKLASVLLAGIFLPAMLLFSRLTVKQYFSVGTVYLATATWFSFRPEGLAVPNEAFPALIACLSSTLIVVALASRITRKRTERFFLRWRRARDQYVEHSRMESELKDARAIQLSMLPSEPPRLDWLDYASISLPATEVGGDYFEYFEISERQLAVVIGDVAGHGVASGLVLSGVRSGLHLLRDRFDEPLDVLHKLNSMIRDTAPKRMFVTLQIALLDRQQDSLTVANAGHPPLLAVQASSHKITKLGTRGLPLGTGLEPKFEQQIHAIGRDDTFLLYTDGALEIQDLRGDCFGDHRLATQVERSAASGSARQIRDDLLNTISRFKGDVPAQDDLTLVVLRLR